MSPRPPEIPGAARYAPALERARAGEFDAAIDAVRSLSPEEGGEDAAANVLARIARQAEAAGRWPQAEQAIAAAIALRPRFPDLHHQQACLLLQRGRRAEARAALERALAIHPGYVAARLERALLDARDGRIGEALEELRGLARDCRIGEAPALERGLERLREADVAEAGHWFHQAFRVSDPAVEGSLEEARARVDAGDSAAAIPLLRAMLPRCDHYPDVHGLLGVAELHLGMTDDALASLARALELEPDFHDARVAFACAWQALGQSAQAIEQLQLVLEREPGHADAERLLAQWSQAGSRRARRSA